LNHTKLFGYYHDKHVSEIINQIVKESKELRGFNFSSIYCDDLENIMIPKIEITGFGYDTGEEVSIWYRNVVTENIGEQMKSLYEVIVVEDNKVVIEELVVATTTEEAKLKAKVYQNRDSFDKTDVIVKVISNLVNQD